MIDVLKVQGLKKNYSHRQAVKGIDLTIKNGGSLIAFLGPNGAGKSTTIKMLTTLLKPTAGSIEINGQQLPEKIREQIAVVFQESVMDADLTVRKNLLVRWKLYRGQSKSSVSELIHQVHAQDFQNQKYGSLSGGQKRRVDIARALINQPKILFLDEPTTGLDIQTRSLIWQMLSLMRKKQGMTIFLTTHYLEEAEQADQVDIIDHGQIIAQGTAADLKKRFAKSQLTLFSDELAQLNQQLPKQFSRQLTDSKIVVRVDNTADAIHLLSDFADKIKNFEFRPGTIDDMFMALTGKEIR
ncbi:MAG: ABC transporter ATP-binding protein [Oenococcus sp.]|uniref:ABC transporter ATP-binding protein n=1 Tax=Oenococcus TaxID=46254 RepID=UPI0021E8883A|nr:ABC transporter ATP-binding protein [Oenococcus kitaharae]MCV3295525.1 ABC transporter ATP-binding protein [Oenococcus kitaharae]